MFFKSDADFLERYATDQLLERDLTFLSRRGQAFSREGDLAHTAFLSRWVRRLNSQHNINYVILVPTLRCNLSCTYCQVSRAAETANGYDWTEETLNAVLAFLHDLKTDNIKIEFQGGEPLLRLDLLHSVRDFCRSHFTHAEFVVCTNLQAVGAAEWAFLDADDTYVSTSIDGDITTHERQRTRQSGLTSEFFKNLNQAVQMLGPRKVSALPTIDVDNPPSFDDLVGLYEYYGIRSIYFRPINFQGFARKSQKIDSTLDRWNNLYLSFIDFIIERNHRTGNIIQEYYFTHCLRRFLQPGHDGHVDIRNPNLAGSDYIVISYDGMLFPTDEARMLHRIGHIDLSVGSVYHGIDNEKVRHINANVLNNFDSDCIHCPYQPFCGIDWVDDISRYNRIDAPKYSTWFCRRQLSIFDKIVRLMYDDSEAVRFSLADWAGIAEWQTSISEVHQ